MMNATSKANHHIVPLKVYISVFSALMVLTFVTIQIAYLDLGFLNTVAAVSIACLKGFLVVAYFMHARYGTKLVWVIVGIAGMWFVILIAMTMGDYLSRGWMGPVVL
jgi:cytochrome c oxidase subunit 4